MSGRFGLVVTAMVTPFREDFSLDLAGAQSLAEHLLDHGSDALVVAGTTGEGPVLSHKEKEDLFRAVVEAARGRGKVICNTGTYNTEESIEYTRMAEQAGADGVLVVTPYYNRPPQRGLIAHFTAVARSTQLPVILYNIPSRTACLIETDTLLRLAEDVPNIVGVKDATSDFQAAVRIVKESPPDFDLYSGDDASTFSYVCLGGVGVVAVASHLAGERMKEMIEQIQAGDVATGRKINEDLVSLYKGLSVTTNPIPVKAGLDIAGRPVGPPRLPLVPATPEERAKIEQAMRDAGVI
jgi:4-hydroxy-tetrahydrodipicolinate synthase